MCHHTLFEQRIFLYGLGTNGRVGFRASGFTHGTLGVEVSGSGFRVSDFWVRDPAFRFRVSGFGVRVSDFGFRVSGFGVRVSDFGFRVWGFGLCFMFYVLCFMFFFQVWGSTHGALEDDADAIQM